VIIDFSFFNVINQSKAMKKNVYLFFILSLFTGMIQLYAQQEEETTQSILSDKTILSGFGSPFVEFSSVNNQFAVCVGGGGALMIDHTFFIGGYFEGITTNHYMPDLKETVNIEEPRISFEHGGIWMGYVYKPKKAVHGGLSMKLGWGEIDLEGDGYTYDSNLVVSDYRDRIFTILPQVEVEFNMTKWFKINLGAGYRFVTGIDAYYPVDGNQVDYYDKGDFNSFVGTVSLIFGGPGKKNVP
jgi:hypothetical protein